MGANNKSKIIDVLGAVFIIAFICTLIYFLYELENQVSERDAMIENLQKENKDLVHKTNNLIVGGKIITMDELVKYTNKINRQLDSVEIALEYYKTHYDMTQDLYQNDFYKKQKNDSITLYTLSPKVPRVEVYNELKKELDSLRIANSHNNWALKKYGINLHIGDGTISATAPEIDSLKRKQQMYDYAVKAYDIKIIESKDGKTFSVKAPKIDSALILLPYYRDMIKKESDSTWTITHPKK